MHWQQDDHPKRHKYQLLDTHSPVMIKSSLPCVFSHSHLFLTLKNLYSKVGLCAACIIYLA